MLVAKNLLTREALIYVMLGLGRAIAEIGLGRCYKRRSSLA